MGTGVIYNASLLPVEYLIYDVEESVLLNQQDINGIPQFQASIEDVTFKGFHKGDKIITANKFESLFQFVDHTKKPHFDLGEDNFGKKKLSVRTRVGNFINYLIKDRVIEHRQDMCIKIKADLTYRPFDENEIARQFDESAITSSMTVGGGGDWVSFNDEYLMQKKMEKYTTEQVYNHIQMGLKQYENTTQKINSAEYKERKET